MTHVRTGRSGKRSPRLSIHAPARGATRRCPPAKVPTGTFNPRTRAGCDDEGWVGSRSNETFQSTHPRGVRPRDLNVGSTVQVFQSTHPRGVRLSPALSERYRDELSIHAPARGATLETSPGTDAHGFQSTHPRGVRPPRYLIVPPSYTLSIHAPARGATCRTACPPGGIAGPFNPRTRAGCDANTIVQRDVQGRTFNPRTRAGCDDLPELLKIWNEIFQSTHPRGVRRLSPSAILSAFGFFQSTHPRGVRLWQTPSRHELESSFNPRTRAGCDNTVRS